MNLNQLNWMEEGLDKLSQALSEAYRESVTPIEILQAIKHLVDAEDFDKIAKYIGEN